jgi:hypothetical protein
MPELFCLQEQSSDAQIADAQQSAPGMFHMIFKFLALPVNAKHNDAKLYLAQVLRSTVALQNPTRHNRGQGAIVQQTALMRILLLWSLLEPHILSTKRRDNKCCVGWRS